MLPGENRVGRGVVFLVILLLILYPLCWVGVAADQVPINPRSKITFSLDHLDENGLYGPPGGLRAVHYEFCIPADPGLEAQVRRLDMTIQIFKTSPGRIGCTKEEYLCLGNTHQPNFKAVLLNLAGLPYVKRINQAFFE